MSGNTLQDLLETEYNIETIIVTNLDNPQAAKLIAELLVCEQLRYLLEYTTEWYTACPQGNGVGTNDIYWSTTRKGEKAKENWEKYRKQYQRQCNDQSFKNLINGIAETLTTMGIGWLVNSGRVGITVLRVYNAIDKAGTVISVTSVANKLNKIANDQGLTANNLKLSPADLQKALRIANAIETNVKTESLENLKDWTDEIKSGVMLFMEFKDLFPYEDHTYVSDFLEDEFIKKLSLKMMNKHNVRATIKDNTPAPSFIEYWTTGRTESTEAIQSGVMYMMYEFQMTIIRVMSVSDFGAGGRVQNKIRKLNIRIKELEKKLKIEDNKPTINEIAEAVLLNRY